MTYGITGNVNKDALWQPAAELISWLMGQNLSFCMNEEVSAGLHERQLIDGDVCRSHTVQDLAEAADLILSFGGDGTLLRTAHLVGERDTPILGINIGRLGFLADVQVDQLQPTIQQLERGDFTVEPRLVLEAKTDIDVELEAQWALNEFVIDRSGPAALISIDVIVDGVPLNTYWADGLIIATPTGSTAYSLAVGSPIIVPGSGVIILTPIAPHSLTVRPIVLPASSVIEARVRTRQQPYLLAADGRSTMLDHRDIAITIRRAEHQVHLVKLPDQTYFRTIRTKLMWGAGHTADE